MTELYDTHCHIQAIGRPDSDRAIREAWGNLQDPEPVIDRAAAAGVTRYVCVGCDLLDSAAAIQFAKPRTACHAAVGIHPHESRLFQNKIDTRKQFELLLSEPKVVAIGECGLDYYREYSTKAEQRAVFELQLELAIANDKPVIFHVRDAFEDFWPCFAAYYRTDHQIRGVLHSFTGSQADMDRALSYGLFLGVNGIATFSKLPWQQETFRTIPLQYLLLETDAPFLTPSPYRGTICEPYHIRVIAEYLAGHRNVPVEAIAEATTQNAQRLFGD